eukprot:scaffold152660_cov17-Tisochrysis_lutea.AAC.1
MPALPYVDQKPGRPLLRVFSAKTGPQAGIHPDTSLHHAEYVPSVQRRQILITSTTGGWPRHHSQKQGGSSAIECRLQHAITLIAKSWLTTMDAMEGVGQ